MLQHAIERTFHTRTELFASPLSCSTEPCITYCSAFLADYVFGALHNAFSYKWTGTCGTNPGCDPEDMKKAMLHALASSKDTTIPFLAVFVLKIWEDCTS